jgi:hypothetical protein
MATIRNCFVVVLALISGAAKPRGPWLDGLDD